jgi:hypothetical protein
MPVTVVQCLVNLNPSPDVVTNSKRKTQQHGHVRASAVRGGL